MPRGKQYKNPVFVDNTLNYDAAVEKSFNDENYEFFNELIMDRVMNLVEIGDCEESLEWVDKLEKKYADKLSVLDLSGFYVNGYDAAMECDNADKLTYYQNKIETIRASDEYATAVAENDYRIIGVDIPSENELGNEGEEENEQ